MTDLFGDDTPIIEPRHGQESILSKWTKKYNYRKAEGKEKCGNCEWHCSVKFAKVYHKCQLIGCSASSATDIRVNNVCDAYQEEGKK